MTKHLNPAQQHVLLGEEVFSLLHGMTTSDLTKVLCAWGGRPSDPLPVAYVRQRFDTWRIQLACAMPASRYDEPRGW